MGLAYSSSYVILHHSVSGLPYWAMDYFVRQQAGDVQGLEKCPPPPPGARVTGVCQGTLAAAALGQIGWQLASAGRGSKITITFAAYLLCYKTNRIPMSA